MKSQFVKKALRWVLAIVVALGAIIVAFRLRTMLSGEPEVAWILLVLAALAPLWQVRRTERQLAGDFRVPPYFGTIPDDRVIAAESAYRRAISRNGIYWMILCVVFITLYLPLGDDAELRYSHENSAIRTSELKYFGRAYRLDGFTDIEYFSWTHEVGFYAVWLVPVFVGIASASAVYKRLNREAVMLWLRRPDKFDNLFP